MLEVSTSTSRAAGWAAAWMTGFVVVTMTVLSGVAPQWCNTLARDAALRSTRPGQRQALKTPVYAPERFDTVSELAIDDSDARGTRPFHSKFSTPTTVVSHAAALPTRRASNEAWRVKPAGDAADFAPTSDGRAPPVV